MILASVNSVYSLVKDIANANQRGFITPSQFNEFAINAQQQVFQEILSSYDAELIKRKRGVSHSKGAFNSLEQIQDMLRPLLKYNVSLMNVSANVFSLPSDYSYHISTQVEGVTASVTPPEKANVSINSFLAAPKITSPICVLQGSQVTLYPATIDSGDDVTMTYYKYPQGSVPATGLASTSNPSWSFTTVSNVAIYNPTNSIDFELPKALEYRLAEKILIMSGINMRDTEMVGYAQFQEQIEAQRDSL